MLLLWQMYHSTLILIKHTLQLLDMMKYDSTSYINLYLFRWHEVLLDVRAIDLDGIDAVISNDDLHGLVVLADAVDHTVQLIVPQEGLGGDGHL